MQASQKKVFTIIIAAAMAIAFFMPWASMLFSISAWDMVFGSVSGFIDFPIKYLSVLIPLTGIFTVCIAAFNNEKYPFNKTLLFLIPILTLVILFIYFVIKLPKEITSNLSSDMLQGVGIGFWITLIGSVALPFFGQNTATIAESENESVTV